MLDHCRVLDALVMSHQRVGEPVEVAVHVEMRFVNSADEGGQIVAVRAGHGVKPRRLEWGML
jgi:hypothetical protein